MSIDNTHDPSSGTPKPDPGAPSALSRADAAPGGTGAADAGPVTIAAPAMAYDAIAQASAITVQDAATFMRMMSTVTAAAIAKCTELYIASGQADSQYQTMIANLTKNMSSCVDQYTGMGTAAATVLGKFSKGSAGN
ncbi:hypothetical protein [Corallococcus exiguus]|uniref:hypothetical protein n=1 Tax=Corallococcus exiguus TaxID=83462 RepID=UPI00155F5FF3|nr:hypothetical protein [Corallococcus exiguus]NRD43919.1 hypothetical protein [Corallococcus exiguus]